VVRAYRRLLLDFLRDNLRRYFPSSLSRMQDRFYFPALRTHPTSSNVAVRQQYLSLN
jgi:hypothetical protein